MPMTPWQNVTITVEVAFSASTGTYGAWGLGLWGTATWGPDLLWSDVTADVLEFSCTRGRKRSINQFPAATGKLVLLNMAAQYSPSNLAGPYVSAGVTGVRPWRPVRVRATVSGVTYTVFYGYATTFKESYGENYKSNITELTLTDEFAKLAKWNGIATSPVGAGETTGQRIHRLLNATGNTAPRDIQVGVATCLPTTLAQNALTEMKLVADSEGGAVYVESDGTICFRGKFDLIESVRSNTSQATFADSAGVSNLRYTDIETDYTADLLYNRARVARVGGTSQEALDADSIALYFESTYSRTDLVCESDAQCLGIAQWIVNRFKQPELRPTGITINPEADATKLWPEIFKRKIRDRVTVQFKPRGLASTITKDVYVEGVSHSWTPQKWVTKYDFSATDAYSGSTGRWGSAVWDTATWFF